MKIDRKELREAVKIASKLTNGHGSFPILQCVFLDGPGQRLIATDLEIAVFAPLEITDYTLTTEPEVIADDMLEGLKAQHLKEVASYFDVDLPGKKSTVPVMKEAILEKFREEAQAGSVREEQYCLNAADFGKILGTLDVDVVEISPASDADGNGNLFGANTSPRVKIGENFHDLATYATDEFPMPVQEDTDAADLVTLTVPRKGLSDVAIAGNRDEDYGFKLNSLYFDLSDRENPSIVATDGHRLHWTSLHGVDAPESVQGFTVPLSVEKMLKAVFPKDDDVVSIEYCDKSVRIPFGEGGLLLVREPEGKFPDWKMVARTERDKSVTIAKEDMERPLRQALAIAGADYRAFQMKFNGGIDVEFTNPEKGAYQKISIPIKSKNYDDGEEFLIGINGKLVLDAMGPIDSEDLVIEFADATKPIYMGQEDYHSIVMPMRV